MRPAAVRMPAAFLALVVLVLSAPAPIFAAQDPPAGQPQVGQPGKDVVWVRMADTTSKDLVVDLGSGDGRIPIAAAKKFGARGLGVEYDADLVRISVQAADQQGVADRVKFLRTVRVVRRRIADPTAFSP